MANERIETQVSTMSAHNDESVVLENKNLFSMQTLGGLQGVFYGDAKGDTSRIIRECKI